MHEERGERVKAAEYYVRYVKVFRDPDPPIAAQVASVRERLTRVTGDSPGGSKR